MPVKKVDYRFKILYALAIVMVVCTHTNGGGLDLMRHWFPYPSIQLAIFAFASGYFYKKAHESAPWHYIWRQFKRLIIPMYLYNFFYGVLSHILSLQGFSIGGYVTLDSLLLAPLYDGNQFFFNVGGWFVVPLFIIQFVNVFFRRLFAGLESGSKQIPEWLFFGIALALGLLGNTLAIKGYNTGWWLLLVRPLYLLPFYAAGIFYRRVLEPREHISTFWLLAGLLAAKYLLAAWLGHMPDYTPMWCHDFTDGAAMPIIVGLLGIAFWLRIARDLADSIGRSRAIGAIADSTYSIMINQFLGFMLVKSFFALVASMTSLFADFDWAAYHSDIWYYYYPFGLEQSLLIYVVAGLVIPIFIQRGINFISRELAALDARSSEPIGWRRRVYHGARKEIAAENNVL